MKDVKNLGEAKSEITRLDNKVKRLEEGKDKGIEGGIGFSLAVTGGGTSGLLQAVYPNVGKTRLPTDVAAGGLAALLALAAKPKHRPFVLDYSKGIFAGAVARGVYERFAK